MCGIAGLVVPQPSVFDEALIRRLLTRLTHRGPDDQGILTLGPGGVTCGRAWRGEAAQLIFLHRRLAILDVTEGGWQPMSTLDGRYAVVYNGELYNYVELREELRALGECFRSQSDTEVLLAAWARWGIEALSRFEGMFAFALLDRRARTVTLARDPFGIKPLYWGTWRGGLAFASEIKVLLELPGLSRAVDPERLWAYLRYGLTDHGEGTLFHAIHQVPAGHVATLAVDRPAAPEIRPYWQLEAHTPLDVSFEEAAATVRRLFLQNVRRQLRSDVPVGAALSGGLDSSAIVSAMRQEFGPDPALHTVSYLADDPALDEARWSTLVARHVGARAHPLRLSPEDIAADLDRLVDAQDEPFGSLSIYAQFRVFRQAREAGIRVMLDGQGADEMFAGYPQYLPAKVASCVRSGRWIGVARFLRRAGGLWPGGTWSLLAAGLGGLLPPRVQAPLRRVFSKELMPVWLRADWFADRGVTPTALCDGAEGTALRARLRHALQVSSLPMLLRYEDRNAMAHSIESRVPFLTTTLVEFVAALPESFLLADDATTKAVFRRAMEGLVPQAILDRRDKIAFTTPEAHWLRGPLRVLAETETRRATDLFAPAVEGAAVWVRVNDMLEGRRPIDATLWRLVNLGVWGRVCGVTL